MNKEAINSNFIFQNLKKVKFFLNISFKKKIILKQEFIDKQQIHFHNTINISPVTNHVILLSKNAILIGQLLD